MAPLKLTDDLLNAAILGFEHQKTQIDEKISEIRQMLNGGSPRLPTATTDNAKPRKKRSAAVRRRMKAAHQLRLQRIKTPTAPQPAEEAKPKRRNMSAASRA